MANIDDFDKVNKKVQTEADKIIAEVEKEQKQEIDKMVDDALADPIPTHQPIQHIEKTEDKNMPVYMMDLEEAEKELIVKSRIKRIVLQSKPPFIPALVRTKDYMNNLPVRILIQIDHTLVKEAWDFYMTNVEKPESADFVEMLNKILTEDNQERGKLIARVVEINLL